MFDFTNTIKFATATTICDALLDLFHEVTDANVNFGTKEFAEGVIEYKRTKEPNKNIKGNFLTVQTIVIKMKDGRTFKYQNNYFPVGEIFQEARNGIFWKAFQGFQIINHEELEWAKQNWDVDMNR